MYGTSWMTENNAHFIGGHHLIVHHPGTAVLCLHFRRSGLAFSIGHPAGSGAAMVGVPVATVFIICHLHLTEKHATGRMSHVHWVPYGFFFLNMAMETISIYNPLFCSLIWYHPLSIWKPWPMKILPYHMAHEEGISHVFFQGFTSSI